MTHLKITQLWAGRRGPLQTALPRPRGWMLIPDNGTASSSAIHRQESPKFSIVWWEGRKARRQIRRASFSKPYCPTNTWASRRNFVSATGTAHPPRLPYTMKSCKLQPWFNTSTSNSLQKEAWTTFPSSVKWPIAVWLGQNRQERVNGHMLKPKGIYRAASFSWKS